jgi:hypothetical protein
MSRRYCGIHFTDADLAGQAIGRQVGRLVWEKAIALINGQQPGPAAGQSLKARQ